MKYFNLTQVILAGFFCYSLHLYSDQPTSTPPISQTQTDQKNQVQKKPIDEPEISTFRSAIQAAELFDLFSGTGPFTIFAPSNEAFERLGKEKVKELLKAENKDTLVSILIYHVIPGKYLSKNIKSMNARTINGKTVNILVNKGEITINGAKVIRKDLIGHNAVIYVIDTVLIP